MSNEDLNTLVKKRSSLKGILTRFRNYIDKIDIANQSSLKELQLRLSKVDSCLDEFSYIQDQIDLIDSTINIDESNEEREIFENNYFSLRSKAFSILESANIIDTHDNQGLGNISEQNNVSNHYSNQNQFHIQNIKLPTLSLPTFSGNFDEWLSFYDIFQSVIHDNQSLTDVQKFHYLKSSIKGDAALIIESLEISAENYKIAWGLLKENFENKPRIINNHIKALFEMNVVVKESHVLLQQLLNTTRKHLRALKMLKQPTEHWNALIVYLVSTKLDHVTQRDWSKVKSDLNDLPTIDNLTQFLTKKCQLLESLHSTNKHHIFSSCNEKSNTKAYVSVQKPICKFCTQEHPIHQCQSFLSLSIRDRINSISNKRLCKNCLRYNHRTNECKASNCKICNLKHNTLLHLPTSETKIQSTDFTKSDNNSNNAKSDKNTISSVGLGCSFPNNSQVLLPTALVFVSNNKQTKLKCRVLLDSASQSNFITEDLFKRLNCQATRINLPVSGINNSQSNVLYETKLNIESTYNSFVCTVSCLVLPEITQHLPQSSLNLDNLNIPFHLHLADPNFHESGEIDMLLGAELFWKIICVGQFSLGKNLPIAQKTQFGWVISGSISLPRNLKKLHNLTCASCSLITQSNDNLLLQQQLTTFWKLEEVQPPSLLSHEENKCEELYSKTTERNSIGQFIVRLPFRDNVNQLGESYSIARRRFFLLENKLETDIELKQAYCKFMQEYIDLGHMTKIHYTSDELQTVYFLPHHAVFKSDSITSKLRVVFDGSCKTISGVSLNDTLMVGPKVQSDLFAILLRFRTHKYAFTSDCEKMYRQVIVNKIDRNKQNIIWRSDKSTELQCFQLNTVTYGTACAPFLATRCLIEIANIHVENYSRATNIIKNDFYIDDLISGSDNVKDATILIEQIDTLLKSGGFTLRKWASNCPDILRNINHTSTIMLFNDDNDIKTLGLLWNSKCDTFKFPVSFATFNKVTKRTILSAISKIFDPLGLIGPIVIVSKILLQRLWQLNLLWDESVPQDIHTLWTAFQQEAICLKDIVVPRHVLCVNPANVQLHAFSDASESSYGTCIYLRSTNSQGQHTVNLLCAKSRVAPLKSLTLPRLELCAAHLSSKLVHQVRNQLHLNINEYYFWCDSTIVLAWLLKPPSQLKPFVANRVADIISVTEPIQWHHIRTHDNPADIISRGTTPIKLKNCSLWWHGPSWLISDKHFWPISNININKIDIPELKITQTSLASTLDSNFMNELILKYSKLKKLQRIIVYCVRFINNCKKPLESRILGSISVAELQLAMIKIIKPVQMLEFGEDIRCLRLKQKLPVTSKLLPLNPFLDENSILRVGGRLRNSKIPYSQKFPCLLPNRHHLTTLIIRDAHFKTMHAGPQSILSIIRRNGFWPIAGLAAVKRVTKNCVICKRMNLVTYQPLMGDLPHSRITPSRPFSICGTDFAGPFTIKESLGRGRKTTKAYLCLFVCFSTKATHLETVSSLSTDSFIACLRRFISRRGLCKTIYSDNATNYVSANEHLKRWYRLACSTEHNQKISNFLSNHLINWKFIPTRSPHFGGLWESLIKSVKRHLHRITRNQVFTFEEISTLFTQIEAILNSRPLMPLSSDPSDYNFLSPAHFLIGDSLLALPEPNVLNITLNHLSHFKMLQHLQQQFWRSWTNDYLNLLQSRTKWKQTGRVIQVGTLVLLRDHSPPLCWRMGRVTEVHPGEDDVIRVVTVKTSTGFVKRAVNQLCELLNDVHTN